MSSVINTVSTPGWDAGAITLSSLANDGYYSFKVGQSVGIVCGLNTADTSADYNEIQHGFYIENNKYRIIESGSFITSLVSYAKSDTFKIERTGTTVTYYKNSTLVYTSLQPSFGTCFLDCSLFAYLDEIFDATLVDAPAASESISIELSPLIAFSSESDVSIINIELSSLTVDLELLDSSTATVSLLPLIGVATSDTDFNLIKVEFSKLTASLALSVIVPDYSLANVNLPPLSVLISTDPPDSNEVDVELSPLIAFGTSDDVVLGFIDLRPIEVETYLGRPNRLIASLPTLELLFSFKPIPSALHEAIYCSVSTRLHTAVYQDNFSHVHQLHTASWSTNASRLHTAEYDSASSSSAFQIHEVLYSSLGSNSAFAQHDSLYSSLGGSTQVFAEHITSWSSTGASSAYQLHEVTYESFTKQLAAQFHESLYASLGGATQVFNLHESLYASLGGATQVYGFHESLYASLGGATQVFNLHETSWESIPDIRQLHTATWKSVIAAQRLHTVKWKTDTDIYRLHEVRYRSLNTTPLIQGGLIYVRV